MIWYNWIRDVYKMKYEDGKIVKGCVTGIENYGIFISFDEYYSGLIHISEISNNFVRNINDYIKIKDRIYAQVVDIDFENSKFKLSIKNIDYRNDGKFINGNDNYENGFEPLKNRLELWISEKIKEIMDKM